jgi:hypothetical protein
MKYVLIVHLFEFVDYIYIPPKNLVKFREV